MVREEKLEHLVVCVSFRDNASPVSSRMLMIHAFHMLSTCLAGVYSHFFPHDLTINPTSSRDFKNQGWFEHIRYLGERKGGKRVGRPGGRDV